VFSFPWYATEGVDQANVGMGADKYVLQAAVNQIIDLHDTDLLSPAKLVLHNVGTTGLIQWGLESGYDDFAPVGSLAPGEFTCFTRINIDNLVARGTVGGEILQTYILEA
jgi:hypothetical protein